MTKVLRVYDELKVEVVATDAVGKNPLNRSQVPQRPSPSFERMYANQFGNYPSNRTEPPSSEGGGVPGIAVSEKPIAIIDF